MPTYEYKCDRCGHEMPEVEQRITDQPLVVCPACGHSNLKRQLFPVPTKFNGGGWTPKG